jgi:catechol 2,3-dioxygenase-like lactoylglutathione lyase family enzyme
MGKNGPLTSRFAICRSMITRVFALEKLIIDRNRPSPSMPRRKCGLRLHQVILRAKDLERSKQFYTKKLGFKVKYDYSPEYLAVVTPNQLQIGFHPGNQSRTRKAHGDQLVGIGFEVDDVDALYGKLRKLGVKFIDNPTNAWGEREARFLDPDGYRIAISGPVGNHLV